MSVQKDIGKPASTYTEPSCPPSLCSLLHTQDYSFEDMENVDSIQDPKESQSIFPIPYFPAFCVQYAEDTFRSLAKTSHHLCIIPLSSLASQGQEARCWGPRPCLT